MIIDEFELAENILASKHINKKSDLFVVAKYLRNEIKCDVAETVAMLDNILTKSDKNYNPIKMASYLESMAIKASDYQLKKVEKIQITRKELKTIHDIQSQKLQRLAFSLLVYAKYNNMLSSDNNGWCNISINDLYKTARVSTRNANEKALFLNKLNQLGLISFSKKNTNLNIRCCFIDDSDDYEMSIDDIRELGYQYLSSIDGQQFLICKRCGVIIKKKSKNDYSAKYCKDCLSMSRNENLLKSFHKLD